MRATARLLRARLFTLTACVSLALAVGANSAIFSIVNALWFRPLPVRDPGRLLVPYLPVLHSVDGELLDEVRMQAAEYLHELSSFQSVTYELNTASRVGDWRPIVRLEPSQQQIQATAVAVNYFDVLGVPVRGRSLAPQDGVFGAPAVAVISERFRRRLVADGDALGSVLKTSRGSLTIVGVAPDGFHGPRIGDQVDLWMPFGALGTFSEMGFDPRITILTPVVVFARLRPDATPAAAEAEIRTMLDPRTRLRSLREVAFPLRSEGDLGRQRNLLRMLWLTAGLVLLLGAGNLAALFAARATDQRYHWAVRLSVGDTRRGLLGSVLQETFLITIAGVGIGLLFRFCVLKSIVSFEPAAGVALADLDLSLDWRILLFAIGVALLAALLASAGAMRLASRADVSLLLASSSAGTRTGVLSRQILLASHVALGIALLIPALGLIGQLRHTMGADLGFARDKVVFAAVRPALTQYMREIDDVKGRAHDYVAAMERIAALPDVHRVSYGAHLLEARPEADGPTVVTVDGRRRTVVMTRLEAGPGYLQTAGADLIAGRDLSVQDAKAAVSRNEMFRYLMMRRHGQKTGPPPKGGRSTAVIDAALASALFPEGSAVGRSFVWESLQITYEIVGVVRELRRRPGELRPVPTLIAPLALGWIDGTQSYDLVVATRGDPRRAIPSIAGVLRELFPDAPILEVKTANQVVETVLAQERMGARMFSWYAVAAVVLALAGVHGMLAFFIIRTRRDLAIRLALGATPATLIRITAARVLAPVAMGVLSGLLVAAWLRRILGSTVTGFTDLSVGAQTAAALLFMALAVAVSLAGTRHLRRMNPAETLRSG